jgi:hypothetical protein
MPSFNVSLGIAIKPIANKIFAWLPYCYLPFHKKYMCSYISKFSNIYYYISLQDPKLDGSGVVSQLADPCIRHMDITGR